MDDFKSTYSRERIRILQVVPSEFLNAHRALYICIYFLRSTTFIKLFAFPPPTLKSILVAIFNKNQLAPRLVAWSHLHIDLMFPSLPPTQPPPPPPYTQTWQSSQLLPRPTCTVQSVNGIAYQVGQRFPVCGVRQHSVLRVYRGKHASWKTLILP